MTWIPSPDQMVSVNALVLLGLFAGCLVGVFGGFFAIASWGFRKLELL